MSEDGSSWKTGTTLRSRNRNTTVVSWPSESRQNHATPLSTTPKGVNPKNISNSAEIGLYITKPQFRHRKICRNCGFAIQHGTFWEQSVVSQDSQYTLSTVLFLAIGLDLVS